MIVIWQSAIPPCFCAVALLVKYIVFTELHPVRGFTTCTLRCVIHQSSTNWFDNPVDRIREQCGTVQSKLCWASFTFCPCIIHCASPLASINPFQLSFLTTLFWGWVETTAWTWIMNHPQHISRQWTRLLVTPHGDTYSLHNFLTQSSNVNNSCSAISYLLAPLDKQAFCLRAWLTTRRYFAAAALLEGRPRVFHRVRETL
jgi:hypothetical protein